MKLLIICTVFSVCVAVSLAGPFKRLVLDEDVSSSSAESGQLKIAENDSSSSEEEHNTQRVIVKDDLSGASEEQREGNNIVEDETNEITSDEEPNLIDNYVISRTRRTPITPYTNSHDRRKRNADTSEENSSEEEQTDKSLAQGAVIAKDSEAISAGTAQDAAKPDAASADSEVNTKDVRRRRNTSGPDSSEENSSEEKKEGLPANGADISQKSETAPAESLLKSDKADAAAPAEGGHKSEILRRRRSAEDFSEENLVQDENEVFTLSKEKQTDDAENNEDDKYFENPEPSSEDKNSEEDYAQGCGGNRNDNSNENSNEMNETLNDNL